MAANVSTGTIKSVRYCGADYEVRPGEVYGKKQAWLVICDGEQISQFTPTRSKAVKRIHEHTVESGRYPALLTDGCTYAQLVTTICG